MSFLMELSYREQVTPASALPTRPTRLRIQLPHRHPWQDRDKGEAAESLTVAVEVSVDGGPFVERASFGPFTDPTNQRFDMPRADPSDDAPDQIMSGRKKTLFRLVVRHRGKSDPGLRMDLV